MHTFTAKATDTSTEIRINVPRLDDTNIYEIAQEIAKKVGPNPLLLDFDRVEFLTSTVLGKLVGLNKRAEGRLRLLNVNENLLEIFRITRLDTILDVQAKNSPN